MQMFNLISQIFKPVGSTDDFCLKQINNYFLPVVYYFVLVLLI